jgi:hypothetical protein
LGFATDSDDGAPKRQYCPQSKIQIANRDTDRKERLGKGLQWKGGSQGFHRGVDQSSERAKCLSQNCSFVGQLHYQNKKKYDSELNERKSQKSAVGGGEQLDHIDHIELQIRPEPASLTPVWSGDKPSRSST